MLIQAPIPPLIFIYTSGSTGKPKGVIVQHSLVLNLLSGLHQMFPFGETDVYLLKTPVVFDVSVSELFGWFYGAGRLAILEPGEEKDPTVMMSVIARKGVTHLNFVPSMFNIFVDLLAPKRVGQLAGLKYIFLAGEELLPAVVDKFRTLNKEIVLENLYGPTEATVYASRYALSGWTGNCSIPIGKPLQNTHLYILDKEGHIQPTGVPGELCISGAGVACGYLNRPLLSKEKFIPNPFQTGKRMYFTGDLACYLFEGYIQFLGRIDQQVKIRGFRIEPGEIQTHLMNYRKHQFVTPTPDQEPSKIDPVKSIPPKVDFEDAEQHVDREPRINACDTPPVKDAVVIAKTNENGEKYLRAYLVSDEALTVHELREYLAEQLPDYMIPGSFMQVKKIPLTPNGKIDREALDIIGKRLGTGSKYTAPGNDIERKIQTVWKETLHLDQVSIHDNYFDLGGTSFEIIVINERLREVFQVDIPVVNMFRYTTIKSFALYLNKEGSVIRSRDNAYKRAKKNRTKVLNSRKRARRD